MKNKLYNTSLYIYKNAKISQSLITSLMICEKTFLKMHNSFENTISGTPVSSWNQDLRIILC